MNASYRDISGAICRVAVAKTSTRFGPHGVREHFPPFDALVTRQNV